MEASIRYLPLYPDERGVIFNEALLKGAYNVLADVAPDFAELAGTIVVVDVTKSYPGRVLRIAMNAEEGKALACLSDAGPQIPSAGSEAGGPGMPAVVDHWRWRLRMAERIARQMDGERFGVNALYIFGSVKNASAGPGSDIDLLVHMTGTESQRHDLLYWLEGWSRCLAEMNFQRCGVDADGLLDVHMVTDEDIARKTSYAVKIGAVTDAARPLLLKNGG